MPRLGQKPRHSNKRRGRQGGLARLPRRVSDEAISIYIRNLPASADKQSVHDWCRRTLYNGLGADSHQRNCEDIVDEIWIAKPVTVRSDQANENIDCTTQKLRYAHVRFQHSIFKRLMMAHAKPEEYDGISKPEVSTIRANADTHLATNTEADKSHYQIQKWKSKATRHVERNLVQANVEPKGIAQIVDSKKESVPSSQAVDSIA